MAPSPTFDRQTAVEEKIEQRIYPKMTVDVQLVRRTPPYTVAVTLSGFEHYHVGLCKRYGLTFDFDSKTWRGNLWVVLDFVVPNLKAVPMNIFIDGECKRVRAEVEAQALVGGRVSRERFLSSLKVPPLVGKHPHEDFQVDSAMAFLQKKSYGLFLKQGTGKSWVISATTWFLLSTGQISKAILLTPGSGLLNLRRALLKFTHVADERICIVTKNNRNAFDQEADILIMTYSTLRLVHKHYSRIFVNKAREWLGGGEGALIIDEGHYIGVPTSQQSRAVHDIAPYFSYRMPSTGTPADKPDKYYSILKFIHPHFVRYLSFSAWKAVVAEIGTAFSQFAIAKFRENEMRYFIESASSHYTNLKDTEVLDLPEHYFKEVYVELEGLQMDIYSAFSQHQLQVLKDQNQGRLTPLQVFNKFPYLLLSIDNPDILSNNRTFETTDTYDTSHIDRLLKRYAFEKHFAKLEVLKELVAEHVEEKGEQIVIWTGHPATADSLAQYFHQHKPLVMHGQVPLKKGYTRDTMKDEVVQTFIKNKKHKVLIASYYVLDTAVDIVNAHTQIYVDVPYMFYNFDQSYKRLHRSGQVHSVTTYILLFENTIDELRYNIVQQKRQLDKDALNITMDLESWKRLFSGQLRQEMTQNELNALF